MYYTKANLRIALERISNHLGESESKRKVKVAIETCIVDINENIANQDGHIINELRKFNGNLNAIEKNEKVF